ALEVQREAERVARKLEHFALHHVRQAVDAHDTVGHGDHGALVANVCARFKALDPALDQLADLRGIELHYSLLIVNSVACRRGAQAVKAACIDARRARTEVSSTSSPTVTRTPPISDESTSTVGFSLRLNLRSRPETRLSRSAPFSGNALTISASAAPSRSFLSASNCSAISGSSAIR